MNNAQCLALWCVSLKSTATLSTENEPSKPNCIACGSSSFQEPEKPQESKFLVFSQWTWIQFKQDKDRFLMQLTLNHQPMLSKITERPKNPTLVQTCLGKRIKTQSFKKSFHFDMQEWLKSLSVMKLYLFWSEPYQETLLPDTVAPGPALSPAGVQPLDKPQRLQLLHRLTTQAGQRLPSSPCAAFVS